MPPAVVVGVLFFALSVLAIAVGVGLVVRHGWQLTKLVHEGVATTGVVTEKRIGQRRSVLRYRYQGPDGAPHDGAAVVEGAVWSAAQVGGAIGVVYVAARPWISGELGEVNASRGAVGLPPL